ncbi:hypothetical protein GCM10010343_19880 [Streptomyces avidinii]|nr:hypothetical protein GCM10010343_19880 [Streptomyces avidinii]
MSQRFPDPAFIFAETGGNFGGAASTAWSPVVTIAAVRPTAAVNLAANRHLDGMRMCKFKSSSFPLRWGLEGVRAARGPP